MSSRSKSKRGILLFDREGFAWAAAGYIAASLKQGPPYSVPNGKHSPIFYGVNEFMRTIDAADDAVFANPPRRQWED